MAQNERNIEDKKDKRARERRSARAHRHQTRPRYELELLNHELLWLAIYHICMSGGAIRFGLTRDGGALAIGIYGDGDPYTEYLKPDEDITRYLEELIHDYGDRNEDARTNDKSDLPDA